MAVMHSEVGGPFFARASSIRLLLSNQAEKHLAVCGGQCHSDDIEKADFTWDIV